MNEGGRVPCILPAAFPQGSVLGAILFMMYTVDHVSLVEQYGLPARVYMQMILEHIDSVHRPVSADCSCHSVFVLSQTGCRLTPVLQLNCDKTDFLWLTSSRSQHRFSTYGLTIGSISMIPKTTVCDLAVFIDAVHRAVSRCFSSLRLCSSHRSKT